MQALPIPWLDAFLLAILPVAALAIALVMLRRRRVALARTNARLASERDRVRLALEGSSISLWDWDIAADSVWLDASWNLHLSSDSPLDTSVGCRRVRRFARKHDARGNPGVH